MLFQKNPVRAQILSRRLRQGTAGLLLAAFSLSGCSGSSSVDHSSRAAAVPDSPFPTGVKGTPQRVRLISQQQYLNTLTYIFGPDLRIDARFPPQARVDGLLASAAASAGVTGAQLEQFQRTASQVAGEAVNAAHRDYLIPCKPVNESGADAACATKFLGTVGRLLYRRPLPKDDLEKFVNEANVGADRAKSFYSGLSAALEGMLLSPKVLFIADTIEKDPSGESKMRLDAYSLAQRLSFFLWNATPDDAMLKAAETGEIQTPKGRTRIVDMMLASPRLDDGVRAFFDDMMAFDDFAELSKDGHIYPAFTGLVVSAAREQTLRTIVNFLITEKKDYRDLYTTREAVMTQVLGPIYGLAVNSDKWVPYEFSKESGRAGILTQVSFLALHSHPGRSSPTLRGKALREVLLCQPVPPPPPNVDFSIVDNPNSSLHTARERLELHRKNPVCAGCHKITDPLGLALETFDGAGMYRANERGSVIDTSGALDGKTFDNALGLGQALHDNPALTSCLVRRVLSYGTGGPLDREDDGVVTYLNQRFGAQGYKVPALLRAVALAPMFSEIVSPAPAPAGKTARVDQDLAQTSK